MRGQILGLALALAACGCATAPPPTRTAGAPSGNAAWQLPAEEIRRQYLLRLDGEGPEGRADLKVTLRLESAARFRLAAADALGRRLWNLDVAAGEAIWVGEPAERGCRLRADRSLRLPAVRLDLPVTSVPALLLGHLPVRPRAGGLPAPGERFVGEDGRQWSATASGQRLERWTLWGEDARPSAWWRALDRGAELVLRDPPVVLRWSVVAESPLASPLAGLEDLSLLPECADELP